MDFKWTFLFNYSFNLLYWFILVMRNNIMFCGFISFFLLLNYYYYLLYGIYEHTLKQIHTFNKFKQAICAVPSLARVNMTLKCTFLLSYNRVQLLLTPMATRYSESQVLSFDSTKIMPLFYIWRMVKMSHQ